jgi:hypothetical protein
MPISATASSTATTTLRRNCLGFCIGSLGLSLSICSRSAGSNIRDDGRGWPTDRRLGRAFQIFELADLLITAARIFRINIGRAASSPRTIITAPS